MKRIFTLILLVTLSVLGAITPHTRVLRTSEAQSSSGGRSGGQKVRSRNTNSAKQSISVQGLITVTDSGWTTSTTSSDCATGQADDVWQLTLTQARNVTIGVEDCCCPGDYYEVRVDGNLIGTTLNLAPPWGCDFSGSLSGGSFTVPMCAGTHIITVRDAGFDGHSLTEIQEQGMCPAGFTVSGTLSPPGPVTIPVTPKLSSEFERSPAVRARAQELAMQVQAVTPFVITGKDGMQRLRSDDARKGGVDGETLALGHRLVALNNRIIMAARRNEEPSIDPADFAFIEPLFLEQARFGIFSPCGSFLNPTTCPPRVYSGISFSTEDAAKQYLLAQGYHQAARYASWGGFGIDFTQVVTDPDCGTGPFRNEAVLDKQGDCWTFYTQGPEPNPEVLSYLWPYAAWPGYVLWWHRRYC